MHPWGQNYNPCEMLKTCKVNAFDRGDSAKDLTTEVLALIAIEKDHDSLIRKIRETVYDYGNVSIGRSLDKLHSIATTGPELDFGRDGLDALTYHLGADQCRKGIAALQAVLRRFEEDEAKPRS